MVEAWKGGRSVPESSAVDAAVVQRAPVEHQTDLHFSAPLHAVVCLSDSVSLASLVSSAAFYLLYFLPRFQPPSHTYTWRGSSYSEYTGAQRSRGGHTQ